MRPCLEHLFPPVRVSSDPRCPSPALRLPCCDERVRAFERPVGRTGSICGKPSKCPRPALASNRSLRSQKRIRAHGLGFPVVKSLPLSNRLADNAQPRVTSVAIAALRAPRGGITNLPVGAVVWDDR